jgi:FkbM family methyltransferase
MTFISYAQNFEDIMLWRALKHIEHGFYIDVGAAWPDEHSVTKSFYDAGWQGLNVEPNPSYIARYELLRPRDINLQVAISESEGSAEFYFIEGTGLSSLDKTIAAGHNKLGYSTKTSLVNVTTIAAICEQHAHNKDIHFLKVDIEGFEKQALLGNDWQKFRPWVVVVEATLPMSQKENHQEWEPILTNSDYIFTYADGLNRFYVAKEHSELLAAFEYPPNVFDGYVLASQVGMEAKAQQAEAKAQQAEAKAQQAEAKAQQAEAKAQQVEATVIAIHNSLSWRLTVPVRMVSNMARSLFQLLNVIKPTLKQEIKLLLTHAMFYINRRPKLKRVVLAILTLFPALKSRLGQVAVGASAVQRAHPFVAAELADLTPRARRIYADLKAARAHHSKDNS